VAQHVYSWVEEPGHGEFVEGRPIPDSLHSYFSSSVSLDSHRAREFQFTVSVTNKDTIAHEINPSDITLFDVSNPDSLPAPAFAALDPEAELQADAADLQKADKEFKKKSLVNTCAGIACIFANVISKDDGTKVDRVGDAIAGMAENQESLHEEHAAKKSTLEGDQDFWQFEALRAKVLQPGETATGAVLIETQGQLQRFELEVFFGNESHVYTFQREMVK
jgi:hypothetical protein